ncbi:ABC transporter ATP-binding protein [Donghicola sp. C2-DW-16]|uniref:ABC transporter ATP-binding protein n=2 Tax=Donghicola mangrovi TaxID=2729614 RepID=A0ABX2PER8_9RHOB|nr:ABC transporter ATP-binding protein [Donghicola mangrovi]
MLQNYRHIWALLDRPERFSFIGLVGVSIFMALLEMTGVAAIFPFLKLVGDPSLFSKNEVYAQVAKRLSITEPTQFTLIFGVLVLCVLIAGMVFRAVGSYFQTRFAMMRGRSISRRILADYLSKPYPWHLQRNTSVLSQTLLSEVDLVVQQAVLPSIMLLTNVTVALLIAGFLFLAQPAVALGATLMLGLVYGITLLVLRKPLQRAGSERVLHNEARFQKIAEIGGGIKEIKAAGQETVAIAGFRPSAKGMAEAHSSAIVLGQMPKFALEAVIYGGFVSLILISFASGGGTAQLMPLFGLFGMASLKLFPALQQIFADISLMRFSSNALSTLAANTPTAGSVWNVHEPNKQGFNQVIELKEVSFRFPGADAPAISNINLCIPARSTLGIVGGTGAGKSTMVDLLMGLLPASAGAVTLDGQALITERWQKSIGYVPQQIFLSDDSIAANIAFGVSEADIDLDAVQRAAKAARLDNFVLNELPDGYLTSVGEGGVRLSGGQRQRIGIARALYRNPDVLIFDEATSALDNRTEAAVMEAIDQLAGQKTIIMIAHRLDTVKNCDQIILLDHGQIVARGSYAELLQSSDRFKRLVNG